MINKKYFVSIIIIITLLVIGVLFFNDKSENRVCTLDGKCIITEIADNEQERQTGLMYRESLDENAGMLFIFPSEGIYSFWMKNTIIPLDIVWIDSSNKVVHIENALPCNEEQCRSYISNESSKYVLEVNAGKAKELRIEKGSVLKIKI